MARFVKRSKRNNSTHTLSNPNSFYLLAKTSQQAERNVNILLHFYIILLSRRLPAKNAKKRKTSSQSLCPPINNKNLLIKNLIIRANYNSKINTILACCIIAAARIRNHTKPNYILQLLSNTAILIRPINNRCSFHTSSNSC